MRNDLKQRVIDQILFLSENGFQEIYPETILLVFIKSKDFFMAQKGNSLLLSKDCSKLNDDAFKGVLAHELIHLIQYKNLQF